ncbi:histidine kinase dimerization/phosphoacceptor domain -containing protein [Brevundimonas aurantiaca]|uniref:histidine kinase dimerization/phosphoacceptor domain -containing protein n=1 Tax=Brevundimonas aurantiaca TaxID=74316 RepID=UPI001CD7835A|nr:histidine kinase dimerization/phosphoacceptor domain -containing protein [Brevundimonas aurantiaca]
MNPVLFRRPLYGYGLAVCAWLTALGVRMALADWFPPGFPYLTFFPAVVVIAYFCGLGPAVLTAVLSGLSAWWFWIGAPGFDWSAATGLALAFYVFVVAVDIFFIVGMNAATDSLKREVARNAALAESRDLLLKEVQHRVSNNIQVVSSLLRLEAGMTRDETARRVLSEAAARTALIAKVQRSLLDADGAAAPSTTWPAASSPTPWRPRAARM